MKTKSKFLFVGLPLLFLAALIPVQASANALTSLDVSPPTSTPREVLTFPLASPKWNCYFVQPADGETVAGQYVVDFYGAYDGVTLYACKIAIFRSGTQLTPYSSMSYSGLNHWTYSWDTTAFANGAGYELAVQAYRKVNVKVTYYCSNLVIDNGPDTEPPTAAITNPLDGATVSGTVSVTADASDNVGVTQVDFYIDATLAHTDTASPYSYSWDTTIYADGTSHTIKTQAWDAAGNFGDSAIITVIVNNTIPPGEKIVVFFWATDAYVERPLFEGKYHDIMAAEGYTKFFYFEDSSNVEADMDSVDAYEDEFDTIFVYVIGHGNNNGLHSYTAFKAGSQSIVYSNQFRLWIDRWEAPRKALFVESCHSGDWSDDHAANPYLAMSTSDETHLSYAAIFDGVYEGKMSHYFFEHVWAGYNGVDSFYYAKGFVETQYPKIADYSDYVWFT